MTWATIIAGIAVPVIGWILHFGYLSWKANRAAREKLDDANIVSEKYQKEAEIHAAPARSKSAIVSRLREHLGK